MRRAHAAVAGAEPPIEAATYGADMRHFLHVGQIPCLMYGGGDVRVAHHADEHVRIDDLLTATAALAIATAEWCGVVDQGGTA